MDKAIWKTATLDELKKQADIYAHIRRFFKNRDILEVHTPLLSSFGSTDPGLSPFITTYDQGSEHKTLYLQSSPEFAMKRLLAAHQAPIYQITKAFRNQGEKGRWHFPEFMMLEWYQFSSLEVMIEDILMLIQSLLPLEIQKKTYQTLFSQHLNLQNVHETSLSLLQEKVLTYQLSATAHVQTWTREDCLNILLDCILRSYYSHKILVVSYFPRSQAMLSEIKGEIALRAEIYILNVEIANIFQELWDAEEQTARFQSDQVRRHNLGLPHLEIDHDLINALKTPLKTCSGVAIGIDRLMALILKKNSLMPILLPIC